MQANPSRPIWVRGEATVTLIVSKFSSMSKVRTPHNARCTVKEEHLFAETSDTIRVPPSVTHAVFRNTLGCELWGIFLSTSKAT